MKKRLIMTAMCALMSASALAQVYECIDSRGNHSYAEIPKGKNCHPASNLGANFSTTPAYKATTINSTDSTRDTTASSQSNNAAIATARKNLADAQKALEEGKKIRLGNERNYVHYQERIKGLEDMVRTRQQELDNAINNKR